MTLLTFVNPLSSFGVSRQAWPAITLFLALGALVNPLPVMYKRSRYWFMTTIVHFFLNVLAVSYVLT
jgi:hypothetical protein